MGCCTSSDLSVYNEYEQFIKVVDQGKYIDVLAGIDKVNAAIKTLSFKEYLSDKTKDILYELYMIIDNIDTNNYSREQKTLKICRNLSNIMREHMYLIEKLNTMNVYGADGELLTEYEDVHKKVVNIIKKRKNLLIKKIDISLLKYIELIHEISLILLQSWV